MTTLASPTLSTTVLLVATAHPCSVLETSEVLQLADAMRLYGGTIFLQHTDRIVAAFACADTALSMAIALLHEQRSRSPGTRLRFALHCGPLNLQATLPGPALNAAIRLVSVAHPGQLLLSAAAHARLSNSLPSESCLHTLGSHSLIHRLRSEPIFWLCPPNAHVDFPPLPVIVPSTMGSPESPLIGRETAGAEIQGLLLSHSVQLLTLTGPGGIGKTRLALDLANQLEEHFLDGVVVVPLATLRSPDLIPPTIAQALTAVGITAPPTLDGLRQALAHKSLLIVLDNFEHLIEGGPQLAALLRDLPSVIMLVTSQVRLHLSNEQEYVIAPLGLPASVDHSYAAIAATPAVQLFVQTARRVQPDFTLTPNNVQAIAAICTRLDGLPLAIELAALHSDRFEPDMLLDNLEQYLIAPATVQLPERQRSLRATLDWSYGLLPSAEQALIRRLSVFVGGCTIEAAEAVCGEVELPGGNSEVLLMLDVLEGLSNLIDASMLRQDDSGQGRLTMLEPIREYALAQLMVSGEHTTLCDRHAAYYAAQAIALNTSTERSTGWISEVADEHPNRLAALEWALAQHDGARALALCAGTSMFWMLRGMYREGLEWCEAALACGETAPLELLLHVWQGAGALAALSHEHEKAEYYNQRVLTLARAQGNMTVTAWALHNLGSLATQLHQFTQAKAYYSESLAVQSQLPRPFALTLNNLGWVAINEYEDTQAEELLRQALELTRTNGDQRVRVFVLSGLAALRLFTGAIAAAISQIIEGCRICQVLGGHEATPYLLWPAAAVLDAYGNGAAAARLLAAAEAIDPQWLQICPSRTLAYRTTLRERICAQLTPTTLSDVWAHGSTLSRMAAIAVAREALEQLVVPEDTACPT